MVVERVGRSVVEIEVLHEGVVQAQPSEGGACQCGQADDVFCSRCAKGSISISGVPSGSSDNLATGFGASLRKCSWWTISPALRMLRAISPPHIEWSIRMPHIFLWPA